MCRQKLPVAAVLIVSWIAPLVTQATAAPPVVKLDGDAASGTLSHVGWDTEGGDRAAVNLLRPKSAVTIRVNDRGLWRDA